MNTVDGGNSENIAKHHVNAAGRRVYSFVFQGATIENPALDPLQQRLDSPQRYGFEVRKFAGGRTAWARRFANGTMMVLNPATKLHDIRDAEVVRILFVSPDGDLLQDARVRVVERSQGQELAYVRLTVNVAIDLMGTTPEAAKTAVMRQVGRALESGVIGSGEVEVLQHTFELSEVVRDTAGQQDYGNTNFSQLLDF